MNARITFLNDNLRKLAGSDISSLMKLSPLMVLRRTSSNNAYI